MGFFSKMFSTTNKYESHPEVLDKIAGSVADTALYQIKNERTKTRELTTHCELGSWSISLNNHPFIRYVGSGGSRYGVRFDKFGMEDVPEEDAKLFLTALKPFLEKHLKALLHGYFPEATYVRAYQTTRSEEHGYDTEYDKIDVIEISVSVIESSAPTKQLNKW